MAPNPGRHEILAQGTFGHFDGPALEAAGGFALCGEIRQHRDDLVRGRDVETLRCPDYALPDAHIKVRIFRVSFLVPPHARIAVHLHHQGGEQVDADGSRFHRRRRVDRFHQIHVERTAHGQPFRKHCAARKHGAMRALLILHNRYLQARLGKRDPLQFVEVFRLLACAFAENLIGEGEESAGGANLRGVRPRRKLSAPLLLRGNISSQCLDINARQIELPDLLLQRHAAHQVVNPLRDRASRISVDRRLAPGRREVHQDRRQRCARLHD